MKKNNYIAAGLSTIGFIMILAAMLILNGNTLSTLVVGNSLLTFNEKSIEQNSAVNENISSASNIQIEKMSVVVEDDREVAPAKSLRVEVFDGLTMDELVNKINKNLGNAVLSGKGELIANYALSKGVDPYLVTAIMIHETGSGTSSLARTCFNVAGQKGGPSCMGSYKGYPSIDEGIKGAIDNIYNNYYARGLTTVEAIGPKYAESPTWVSKINNYINKIRNS